MEKENYSNLIKKMYEEQYGNMSKNPRLILHMQLKTYIVHIHVIYNTNFF